MSTQQDRRDAGAARRGAILARLAGGMSRPDVSRHLGISRQRLSVILRGVPAAELEDALAAGAGKVRCPHCGLWVAPGEAGHPGRREP